MLSTRNGCSAACSPPALSISAVLPAYNEVAVIEQTVRRVAYVLAALVPAFEIVVTDDGSRDGTGSILRQLAEEEQLHLCVVTHPTNRGYGAALVSGIDAATGDLVLMLDADGQFDVSEVGQLLPAMDHQTDLVIGYRARRADPLQRLVNAWTWNHLVNAVFGYTARDIDCAFKLFRRHVWLNVEVRSRGAMFSAEFLIRARRLGFRIKEVPVSHFRRTAGVPTGAHPSVIARAGVELLQLRMGLKRDRERRVARLSQAA